jgi:hypothetical protein
MSAYAPGREDAAKAVADSLVLSADPGARAASIYWWHLARPWRDGVVSALNGVPDDLRHLGEQLLDQPAEVKPYWELRRQLAAASDRTPGLAALFDAAWQVECRSRIGYHLGAGHHATEPAVAAEPFEPAAGERLPDGAAPSVLIVVPFRDRDTGGRRLRNLRACLASLGDQDCPRERYRVAVVEADDRPRWREVIEGLCDHYVFVQSGGLFNKSWTVNVGVRAAGASSELLAVLDADVLGDRSFVSRNVERFRAAGTGGHLPYRDALYLDAVSSHRAVRDRLTDGRPAVDPDGLRGFVLRRPPGYCVWLRTEVFDRISGMDERFEGWGAEDNDFTLRAGIAAPLDAYADPLLHLYHPSAVQELDPRGFNTDIAALSWPAGSAYGRTEGPNKGAEPAA